jgi:phosphonopyruvate decarboxylase
LDHASRARAEGLPFFLLVPRGTIGKVSAPHSINTADHAITRAAAVSELMARLTDQLLVTTTGYLSRQAHHERDRPDTFYMQGSMGHAASIGLGLATARPERRVVVLDGDGAFLMHLGTGATIGASGAENLAHLVVDNRCYESTGGQSTASASVDWRALGNGMGYRTVRVCEQSDLLGEELKSALTAAGPVLCVLRVVPSHDEIHPRASASAGLDEIAVRFRAEAAATLAAP